MEEKEETKQNGNKVISVSENDLADIFEVSGRRIRQMVDEGIAIKSGRGKYDLKASVKAYIAKEKSKGQGQNLDKIKLAKEAENLMHEKLKKRRTELQVLHLEKKMHTSEDVEFFWNHMVVTVKSRIMSLPTKMAPILVGIEDAKEIQAILKREVISSLNELAEYDIDMFESEYDYDNEE